MPRKFIQIAAAAATPSASTVSVQMPKVYLYALADDGSVWARNFESRANDPWIRQPDAPKV